MSSLSVTPDRRRRRQDDEDSDSDNQSGPGHTPSSASGKRLKLESGTRENDDVNDTDGVEQQPKREPDEGDEEENEESANDRGQRDSTQSRRDAPGSADDEFQPGAIVRIKLKDFVTYTSAEFFPGPKLNMVIGPNGTGKSTLVCAICLGLGWGPQVSSDRTSDCRPKVWLLDCLLFLFCSIWVVPRKPQNSSSMAAKRRQSRSNLRRDRASKLIRLLRVQ